jgi:hypothetical protein
VFQALVRRDGSVDPNGQIIKINGERANESVIRRFLNTPIVVIVFYLSTIAGGAELGQRLCVSLDSVRPSTSLVTRVDAPFNFAQYGDNEDAYSLAIIRYGQQLSKALEPVLS